MIYIFFANRAFVCNYIGTLINLKIMYFKTFWTHCDNVVKSIVWPFEFRGVTWLIRPGIINWRPGRLVFFLILMTQSHERSIKPFTTAWITGMALSIQIRHCILPNPTIPEDDLPRMAKSRKMIYRVWPNLGLRQAGISKEDLMKPVA